MWEVDALHRGRAWSAELGGEMRHPLTGGIRGGVGPERKAAGLRARVAGVVAEGGGGGRRRRLGPSVTVRARLRGGVGLGLGVAEGAPRMEAGRRHVADTAAPRRREGTALTQHRMTVWTWGPWKEGMTQ